MVKKLSRAIILVLGELVLWASFVYAAGLGIYIDPLESGEFSVAVVENVVVERENKEQSNATKDKFEDMTESYAKLSFGVTDFAKIYGLLGALNEAELEYDWNDGSHDTIDTDQAFLYGGGLGIVLSIQDEFFIGSDTHYLRWSAQIDNVIDNGVTSTNVSGRLKYYEVQETIYIAKKFDIEGEKTKISFIPYVGGVFQYSEYDLYVDFNSAGVPYNIDLPDVENENKVGGVVGADIEFEEKFRLNIEGRFLSETAVTFGAALKF